jgi:hypothetical protein
MIIQMLDAKAVPDTALWGRWDHARFALAVGDVGFEKEVVIHLADGREYPAHYMEPLSGRYELWECVLPLGGRELNLKFAIRYTVNGQTYWDNNHGWDYVLDRDHTHLQSRVVPIAA